jgi:parvulin-like peptidyl-prolyl isomerase
MQKKLIVMASSFCVMVSLCFAQDVKPAADAKVAKTDVKPAKIEMPKMPELDPKTWDFLPDVVATVGDTKITKTDLVRVLNPQAKMMVMMGQKLTNDDYKNLAKGLTQELIKATIVENLAANAGYKVTPELEDQVYNKFIDGMKKQMPDSKNFNFEDMIKQQGLTVADVKKQMAVGEVVQKWVNEKIIPQIKVSDSDVKSFYDKNKETLFKKPETVTASHILFKPKESAAKSKENADKSWEDAKATAEKVYKEIKDGKTTFEAAAKQYSEGPSKDNGGQLGTFAKGQMVPEFEAACWKLAQGNMSGCELIKTQFGWHIVKVTAYDKGGYIALDDKISSQINERLKQEAVFREVNKKIDVEMKSIKPKIFLKDSVANTIPVIENK